jgi:hypothetical protein
MNTPGVPVHVGLVSKAFVYMPLWAAQRRRLFEKAGLAVTAEVLGVGDGPSIVFCALKDP